ncbi:hypothetical protein Tco_0034421 [Tanacetum coccineum]
MTYQDVLTKHLVADGSSVSSIFSHSIARTSSSSGSQSSHTDVSDKYTYSLFTDKSFSKTRLLRGTGMLWMDALRDGYYGAFESQYIGAVTLKLELEFDCVE